MHQSRSLPRLLPAAAVALALGLAISPLAVSSAQGAPQPLVSNQGAAAAPASLPWMDTALSPEVRADLLIAAMNLDQKIQQLGNKPQDNNIKGTYLAEGNKYVGCNFQRLGRHVEGIPELAIPTLREVNGGNGIRGGDCVDEPVKTGGPAMTNAAASFNPEATYAWGEVVGSEAKTFAHQILLGPGLNLVRTPYAGRAQEYPGEDPYLAGKIAGAEIAGIQSQGVQAQMKHWVANENEFSRERWTTAVRMSSRALHELYLLPFEMAVKEADVASVMCAFPHLNGEWACDSVQLNQTVLRDQWGFTGWIESDRWATHSTVKSLKAGIGYELNTSPLYYTPAKIKAAIAAGQLTEGDLDAVLKPRYLQMFKFGQFDTDFDQFLPDNLVANAAKARVLAEESITLLKNERNRLPLKAKELTSIAVIGHPWFTTQAAIAPRNGDPAALATVVSPYSISGVDGIKSALKRAGSNATVTYADGSDLDKAEAVAKAADVVIFMAGTNPRETQDLLKLNLPKIGKVNQHDVAWRVLKANPNNVVVLKTAAGITMNWSGRANAIVNAWFPGQDDGDVVARVLFGETNPSGKSPVTWPVTDKEAAWATDRQYPGVYEDTGIPGGPGRLQMTDEEITGPVPPQRVVRYEEGLAMGYRWYEKNGVKPVYAFGHGLSYTTYSYSDLKVNRKVDNKTGRTTLDVSFRVSNTGRMDGKEAAQVYLTLPNEAGQPAKRLVGFDKVFVPAGKSKKVTVTIDSESANHPFSYFVPRYPDDQSRWAEGRWVNAKGIYTVHVGGASDSTPLTQQLELRFAKK